MSNGKTAVTIALALGLSYVPPSVYADHHEGSGAGQVTSEAKDAATEMKDGGQEAATDTAEKAAGQMEDKAAEAAKKRSEGSH